MTGNIMASSPILIQQVVLKASKWMVGSLLVKVKPKPTRNSVVGVVHSLCFLWFALSGLETGAQTTYPTLSDTFSPVSPTAASLGVYGEIPVALHNGTASVSVPLGDLTARTLSLPISLSYHASGNRIADIPGWVGMGWSLNAGGVITREKRSLPDDYHTYGYLDTGLVTSGAIQEFEVNGANPNFESYLWDVISGSVDSEPDIFRYNINGMSGKFAFAPDGSIQTIPDADIEISISSRDLSGAISEWKIKGPDGTTYFLGGPGNEAKEYAQYEFHPIHHLESHVTSWYVRQIRATKGEYINFTYNSYQKEAISLGYESCIEFHQHLPIQCDAPLCPYQPDPLYSSEDRLKLSRIESETHRVEFTTSPRGAGSLGAGEPNLNEIRYYSLISGSPHLTERVTLQYGLQSGIDSNSSRLILASINRLGAGGDPIGSYNMSYYAGAMPGNMSMAVDHLGYYNGANSNQTRIPYGYMNGYTFNANREPNIQYALIGMLKAITYPTGGTTEFEYESHDYSSIQGDVFGFPMEAGGIRIKRIKNLSLIGDPEVIEYNYRRSDNSSLSSGDVMAEPKYHYSHTQNIYGGQDVCRFDALAAAPLLPLSSSSGMRVEYGEVTVIYGQNGEGGKRIHKFISTASYPDIYPEGAWPAGGVTNYEWKRGHEVQVDSYVGDGSGTYSLVQRVSRLYSGVEGGGPDFWSSPALSLKAAVCFPHVTQNYCAMTFNIYDTLSGRVLLSSETRTRYNQ